MTEKTLTALRGEFKALTGKNPSPRLDAAGVQAKIDEHNAAAAAAQAPQSGSSDAGGADGAGAPEAGAEATQGGDNAAEAGNDAGAAEAAAEAAPEAPEGTAYVRHPEHVGCSFRGVEIAPDEEGLCLVPLGAVEELASHGFELIR